MRYLHILQYRGTRNCILSDNEQEFSIVGTFFGAKKSYTGQHSEKFCFQHTKKKTLSCCMHRAYHTIYNPHEVLLEYCTFYKQKENKTACIDLIRLVGKTKRTKDITSEKRVYATSITIWKLLHFSMFVSFIFCPTVA